MIEVAQFKEEVIKFFPDARFLKHKEFGYIMFVLTNNRDYEVRFMISDALKKISVIGFNTEDHDIATSDIISELDKFSEMLNKLKQDGYSQPSLGK